MSITQDIEEKLGINIEQLNAVEKETYFSMLKVVQDSQLTPEKLKDFIVTMRMGVERELIQEPEFNYIFIFKVPNRKQILLKARLQNYMLLEAFLMTPDKAEEQLKMMISNIKR